MPRVNRLSAIYLWGAITALPAIAQTASPNAAPTGRDIVVTGQRLPDLQHALETCLARHCPPDQDIAATLAVAENEFVNGNYDAARSTLGRSIDRNKRFAKRYPIDVSNLLRANYRVAEHLGDGDSFRIGTFDTVSALKAGLPDTDPRVLAAEIEVGDMYARFGRVDEATDQYDHIARRAAALGLWNLQGMARLRKVILYSQLAAVKPSLYAAAAKRAANDIIGDSDPHMAPFVQAASFLSAQMSAHSGDSGAVDRMIADLHATGSGKTPILLYQPVIEQASRADLDHLWGSTTTKLARTNYDGQWIDVGFWIKPDGRVDGVDVLRSGQGAGTPGWAKPILAAIGGRRYAPLHLDDGTPGMIRVERYTLTARKTFVTGSRIATRESQPQIEMLDLTAEPAGVADTR